MTFTAKTWELLCILSSSLVVGCSGPWVVMSRSFKSFHPKLFLGMVTHMSQNMTPAMTVLMPFSVLSMIPVLMDSHGSNLGAFPCNVVAFSLSLLSLIVAVAFEVPAGNKIVAWTPESIPEDWQTHRDRWTMVHRIRVLAGVASLLSLVIAALIF